MCALEQRNAENDDINSGEVALVMGAGGVTGTALIEQLLRRRQWKVYGVARHMPQFRAETPLRRFSHIRVDLTDAQATRHALSACSDVTHVFYCANHHDPHTRVAMIANGIDAVERNAPHFSNINLLQGTKYYGSHLGSFKTPAKESDPRVPGCDFYYGEEDVVIERRAGKRWTWTAVRPHSVCGYAAGNPINLITVIAIYGAILRELRQPFGFPGSQRCFESLFNVCDADLLARAAIHVSTTSKCGNQAFNVNNGDYFRWRNVWPVLARFFGLAPAGPQPYLMAEFLRDKQRLWEEMSVTYGLKPFPFARAVTWSQGDYSPPHSRIASEYDIVADLVKIRQHGFCDAMDTEEMFLRILTHLRSEKVIP